MLCWKWMEGVTSQTEWSPGWRCGPTTAIPQTLRPSANTSAPSTRTDSVINVDTSANVRSTQDAIHVSIDLNVRINGLPHHQRRWVESFQRELL